MLSDRDLSVRQLTSLPANGTGTRTASSTRSPALQDHRTSSDGAVRIRHGSRLVVPATAVAGFLVLVAILYVSARHAFAGDSDGATVVLQGHAMGTGNVTLDGWALSLDSFWTVDAVVYTFVELVTGMRGMLMFLVPAMIAASVVVVGALLARDGRRGIAGVAAATTVIIRPSNSSSGNTSASNTAKGKPYSLPAERRI